MSFGLALVIGGVLVVWLVLIVAVLRIGAQADALEQLWRNERSRIGQKPR